MDSQEQPEEPWWAPRLAITSFFMDNSPLFAQLCAEKEKLRKSSSADSLFECNWTTPSSQVAHLNTPNTVRFFERMQRVMAEVVDKSQVLEHIDPRVDSFRFLDIGAAPGAFSQYLSTAFPLSIGTGITLPRARGGHLFTASCAETSRYTVHFEDILNENFVSESLDRIVGEPEYDLAIADCLYLDEKPWTLPAGGPADPGAFSTNHALGYGSLTLTQILIALRGLRQGGSLIMRVSCNGNAGATAVLLALEPLFSVCRIVKPTVCHQLRSSCYAAFISKHSEEYLAENTKYSELLQGLKLGIEKAFADRLDTAQIVDIPQVLLGVEAMTREQMDRDGHWLLSAFQQAWTVQLDNVIAVNTATSKPKPRCRFYAAGHCKYGNKCRFAH
ncbi:hypothetical protein HDU83_009718 [Entophlyctis luteolus]|nr:hypothetical protein HDU83_009718 [Entophlyctis luteolus]